MGAKNAKLNINLKTSHITYYKHKRRIPFDIYLVIFKSMLDSICYQVLIKYNNFYYTSNVEMNQIIKMLFISSSRLDDYLVRGGEQCSSDFDVDAHIVEVVVVADKQLIKCFQ